MTRMATSFADACSFNAFCGYFVVFLLQAQIGIEAHLRERTFFNSLSHRAPLFFRVRTIAELALLSEIFYLTESCLYARFRIPQSQAANSRHVDHEAPFGKCDDFT